MTIALIHNKGYQWFEQDGSFVKGYLTDDFGKTYEGLALLDYFTSVNTDDTFKSKLLHASGLFSVIIRRATHYYIAVDKVRTFPLFYTLHEGEVYI